MPTLQWEKSGRTGASVICDPFEAEGNKPWRFYGFTVFSLLSSFCPPLYFRKVIHLNNFGYISYTGWRPHAKSY